MKNVALLSLIVLTAGCRSPSRERIAPDANGATTATAPSAATSTTAAPSFPLVVVADVPLPGKAVRFDYQDLDQTTGNLVIAHMNDASVVVVKASDGSVVKEIPDIPTARGVVVAPDVHRVFVTSSPNKLVILDSTTFAVVARVDTGSGPDGVGWDPAHKIVGVSDQHDGAASLIADSGTGKRTQIPLGTATGNIVFHPTRSTFFITVEQKSPPDQLVEIDPVSAKQTNSIALPGCSAAHGLRFHPDGKSAFIACEGNAKVVRVDLATHALDVAASGEDPDVMAIDPGLGFLYVAAESGDLVVFDIKKPGLVIADREHPGEASHSVAVDPVSHHVFFPLLKGNAGAPVLRIMKPAGTL